MSRWAEPFTRTVGPFEGQDHHRGWPALDARARLVSHLSGDIAVTSCTMAHSPRPIPRRQGRSAEETAHRKLIVKLGFGGKCVANGGSELCARIGKSL